MGACINNKKAGPTTLGTMFPTLCQDGCVGSLLSFATNAWVPCCPFPTSAEKMLGTKLAVYLFTSLSEKTRMSNHLQMS